MRRGRSAFFFGLVFLLIAAGTGASGQCLLANPSFELAGSGGQVFGGWNQFGVVGSSVDATHGAKAARVTGPNQGGWDVSGFWQPLASSPGDRWTASVAVRHTAVNPLTGQSAAILNIEWRNSSGNLISYESHTVADAVTPLNEVRRITVQSGAAPSGTVSARLLLGVLQSPADPPPDVYYDEAEFDRVGPPSLDDIQWNDFPGGTTLLFSGRTWRAKGPGFFGPGPNLFSNSASATWVDALGRLHVTVKKISNSWYSTEVVLEEPLGYGDYIFTTEGRLDLLDPQVVLGLFLWQYGACFDPAYLWWNPYNEIDVEFSRWGNPGNDIAQFVAQPYDYPGNIHRFAATFGSNEITSHAFRWLPDRVEYRSWRGGPQSESPANLIHSWTYTGPHIPRPEQPRVHINLWRISGSPAANQEVILDGFTFVPQGSVVGVPERPPEAVRIPTLAPAIPSPFRSFTAIRYTMTAPGPAEIAVYDASGRLVRVLAAGSAAEGEHEVIWNGEDAFGSRVASGVYLVQFRAGRVVETQRVVFLK